MIPGSNTNSILHTIFEAAMTFAALLVLTRLLGKKQLSQLTYFNYITGITIGSIAGNMIIVDSTSYIKELAGLITWCLLTVLIAWISQKSPRGRVLLDGQPTIIMKKGVLSQKAIRKLHINMDDITMLLRQQNIFSLVEIDYAILEPDGKLSVLKKPDYQSVVKKDMQMASATAEYLPAEIITDGNIVEKNLQEFNLSEEWLEQQLRAQNVFAARDVFYAELQSDGSLYIVKKE